MLQPRALHSAEPPRPKSVVAISGVCVRTFRLRGLGRAWIIQAALVVGLTAAGSSTAFAATTIKVSSVADRLGAGPRGACTLRDALVVADVTSNPALRTRAEPGGSGALRDCVNRVHGQGDPFKIVLAARVVYTLSKVDDYWFGQDGLPPIASPIRNHVRSHNAARHTSWNERPGSYARRPHCENFPGGQVTVDATISSAENRVLTQP